MLIMTSRCFDGLSWAVTALSLSKPNPACARHRVSETGPASPWRGGGGSVSLQLPPADSRGDSVCTRLPPFSIFHRKDRESVDEPRAERSDLTLAASTPCGKQSPACSVMMDFTRGSAFVGASLAAWLAGWFCFLLSRWWWHKTRALPV